MADKLKLFAALLIVVAGVAGFYVLGDKPDVVRWLVMLAALGVATAVAAMTATGRAAWEFSKESRQELRRVVWPSNRETMQMTLVVVALVVLVALFLWFIDWGLLKLIKLLTGQGA